MNTWYQIKAAAKPDDATEVLLMDEIGGWGITAQRFISDVKAVAGNLRVRINSPGGSVFDGIAIANYLRSRGNVETVVDGLAASAASVVFCAGSTRTMAEGGFLMIHNPWSFSGGDSDEMRKTADVLDRIKGSLLDIYESVSDLGRDVLAAMMDDETWLDGKQALAAGFATSTADAPAVFAKFYASRFSKVPAQISASLAGSAANRSNPADAGNQTKPMSKLREILGLTGPTERETFLASTLTAAGITDEAIAEAQKEGKADFLAALVKERVDAANARATDAEAKAKAAQDEAASAMKRTTDVLAAAGITDAQADPVLAIRNRVQELAARETAELAGRLGIKPLNESRAAGNAGGETLTERCLRANATAAKN